MRSHSPPEPFISGGCDIFSGDWAESLQIFNITTPSIVYGKSYYLPTITTTAATDNCSILQLQPTTVYPTPRLVPESIKYLHRRHLPTATPIVKSLRAVNSPRDCILVLAQEVATETPIQASLYAPSPLHRTFVKTSSDSKILLTRLSRVILIYIQSKEFYVPYGTSIVWERLYFCCKMGSRV
ncbi:hypothetical protein FPQ18DRAFT_301893 [Pyronema domesticum]|nr:hypothetical protein FPQ18DRAFT_301893 [Pyronema domesticum]